MEGEIESGTASTVEPAGASGESWFANFDGDTQGWLENKGWTAAEDGLAQMVRAHRSLESMMGRDKVVWPKDAQDKTAWAEIHRRMGVPSSWEDYGLVPLGADGKPDEAADRSYADGMAQVFLKLGVGRETASALATEHAKLQAMLTAADNDAFQRTSAQDFEALRREWGGEADSRLAAAQRASRAFGLEPATMGKIERAIGTRSMLTLLAEIGTAISEDRGSGAGGFGSGGWLTPEAANARLVELRGDREWTQRYFAGDKSAIAEYDRLISAVASRG
ncbi:hypothetical protein [Dongia sp. agr-C8]